MNAAGGTATTSGSRSRGADLAVAAMRSASVHGAANAPRLTPHRRPGPSSEPLERRREAQPLGEERFGARAPEAARPLSAVAVGTLLLADRALRRRTGPGRFGSPLATGTPRARPRLASSHAVCGHPDAIERPPSALGTDVGSEAGFPSAGSR